VAAADSANGTNDGVGGSVSCTLIRRCGTGGATSRPSVTG